MFYWLAHPSLTGHQYHWSRLPRPGLPSDNREDGQQDRAWAPRPTPAQTLLLLPCPPGPSAHRPTVNTRIQSWCEWKQVRAKVGTPRDFPKGKCPGALARRLHWAQRLLPSPAQGVQAEVQGELAPQPFLETSSPPTAGERDPGVHSLPCSLPLSVPHPCTLVPRG